MKTTSIMKRSMIAMMTIAMAFSASSCKKDDDDDDDTEQPMGKVEVSMTDAPSDDANVKGVFVTVASVMVDGKELESFNKQTIEISSYTEGNAKLLVSDDVEVGSHSKVELMFDYESDADGNSPGTYVMTTDGTKHNLNSSGSLSGMVSLEESFQTSANQTNEIIIDLDLRKSVKREGSGSDQYEFVSSADFQNSFRINQTDQTGTVKGNVDGSIESGEHVVVYAYKKGTYSSSEADASGSTNLRFRNAETSAKADASGNYTLAFVEEGEYEVKAAKYTTNAEGEAEFTTTLNLEMWLGGVLSDGITVDGQSETTLMLKLIL